MNAMYEIGRFTLLLIGFIFTLATLPGTIELIFLTLGAQLPRRKKIASSNHKGKLVIVIPAHDEEKSIGSTIESIKRSDGTVDIVVIADNCSDKTAKIASEKGARVFERNDIKHRGKPYALQYGFTRLQREPYDWFVVIDADSRVKQNFIKEVKQAFSEGREVLQTRYDVLDPHISVRHRLMNIAFYAFNFLRPLGRDRWGLSCGILGNGFGVTKEVIKKVPINVSSVVEDLSYHIQLIVSGYNVHFVSSTSVLGEIPSSGAGVSTQRIRWEGGRFIELKRQLPQLLKGIFKGKYELIEPALDLMLLPLAYHFCILFFLLLFSHPMIQSYAFIAIAVVVYHLLVSIYLAGGGLKDFATLLFAPFYIVWKLLLLFRTFYAIKMGMQWKKTERSSSIKNKNK